MPTQRIIAIEVVEDDDGRRHMRGRLRLPTRRRRRNSRSKVVPMLAVAVVGLLILLAFAMQPTLGELLIRLLAAL